MAMKTCGGMQLPPNSFLALTLGRASRLGRCTPTGTSLGIPDAG